MSVVDRPTDAHTTYSQQYRRCGKAGCSLCAAGAPGHGPYWYAFWREGGRRRSRYLGKQAPAGIDLAERMAPSSVAIAAATAAAAVLTPPTSVTAPMHEPLRVRTLGEFAVWRGETVIPSEQWTSHRAATLFKCLLSAPNQRLHREQVVEFLWPEANPGDGATNLRTTIHLLRQVLDGPHAAVSYLCTEHDVLALAPAGAAQPAGDWLDTVAFARLARAALAGQDSAACRAALSCYGGAYLPDEPYAPWAMPAREAARTRYLDVLLHLAAVSAACGDMGEAEDCLRRALAVEPSHEGAAATLMGLLAAAGRRGEALRVYQALATALEEELDVAPAADITALRAQLLAQEAAPLAAGIAPHRVQPARLTNLPVASTSFVGRAWELAEVRDTLAVARLVTLTGPGGCGKTRLALEVAATLLEVYPDGVWLVELAALADADADAVPRALAAALGVAEQPGRPLPTALAAFLQPRDLLLVLDNCEHLIGACADLAAALLRTCPRLRLLVTSREGLEVAGEHTYRVPSLTVPDPARLPPLERLPDYEAVRLFLERARARHPALALTAANAGTVAQICARLDGLPLAIELAAARVSALPLKGIALRLDDRFRLLTGGPRTALPRQQTLRATLDWSYHLLAEPERVLLRRLAVFAGGWTLDAAGAVCAGDGVAEDDVLEVLSGLAHKSLVLWTEGPTPWQGDGEARYLSIETIRQYALEQLGASGELEEVRRRHALHYLALAETAERQVIGPEHRAWNARLEAEHDNLRAVLHWARETEETTLGLRLAAALGRFWHDRGHLSEASATYAALLAQHGYGAAPVELRAKALRAAASIAGEQGNYAVATRLNTDSVALDADLPPAHKHYVCFALTSLGIIAQRQGDTARAVALCEDGLIRARRSGHTWTTAFALNYLAIALVDQGNYGRAEELCAESLALAEELGEMFGRAVVLATLGRVAHLRGDDGRAARLFREGLTLQQRGNITMNLAVFLEGLAGVLCAQGQPERAGQLLGTATAQRAAMGLPVPPGDRGAYDAAVDGVRRVLGADAFAVACAAGRVMPLEQAIALALAASDPAR